MFEMHISNVSVAIIWTTFFQTATYIFIQLSFMVQSKVLYVPVREVEFKHYRLYHKNEFFAMTFSWYI